ncbi:MAG: carboxylesterase family protein [Deltaproteobacteria bacterium]
MLHLSLRFFFIACLMLGACHMETLPDKRPAKPAQDQTLNAAEKATLRRIAQGELTGLVSENGALVWRGIPFAQPPAGEWRWKAPRAPQPWTGRLAATKNGSACFQDMYMASPFKDTDGDGFTGSEDCLYLNIFTPANAAAGQKLPVMYWIYGGGNVGGHNAAPAYDGSVLAQKHQVIVVAINYRVGVMGWFMHPALMGPGTGAADRSGNWGTLDTIRGLEWVRDNIAAFGGDPGRVTLFGESAGAINVFSLVLSPMARGLFHRAISQSGALQEMPLTTALNFSDDAVPGMPVSGPEVVNKILIREGLARDRAEAKRKQLAMPDAEIKKLLYRQTPAQIYKIVNPTGVRVYPAPRLFSDGAVLPSEPAMKAFAAGRFNKVPMIIGTNRDERRFYLLAEPRWRQVLKTNPEDYLRFAKYGSLAWKQRYVDDIARTMIKAGHHDVYAYRFDWDEEGMVSGINMSVALGAGHTVEIPFVFGQGNGLAIPLGNPDDPGRRMLSSAMMSYWTQFAANGNPGRGLKDTAVPWTPWNSEPGADKIMIFDSAVDGGIRMSSGDVTRDSLRQALLNDREFKDQSIHCEIYQALFRGLAWNEDEYRKLGRDGCAK